MTSLGTVVHTITFFANRRIAEILAAANGGWDEGFQVQPAKGREGTFVVAVHDRDDHDFFLGYL
jgi:hypothetical protein